MRLGDVVKALGALETRGGSAHFARFERMWVLYVHAAHGLRVETGGKRRRLQAVRRVRRLLHELGSCTVEARAAERRPLLETPFGVYAVESVVVATRGVHVGRGMPREAAGSLRRRCGREDVGLERWLYAPPATR